MKKGRKKEQESWVNVVIFLLVCNSLGVYVGPVVGRVVGYRLIFSWTFFALQRPSESFQKKRKKDRRKERRYQESKKERKKERKTNIKKRKERKRKNEYILLTLVHVYFSRLRS